MATAFSSTPLGIRTRGSARGIALGVFGFALAALAVIGVTRLVAQIETERGIAPIASSTDIHVTGIKVDVTGEDGEEARREGWRVAQRKAWESINGPKLSDGQLDAMVNAIVIEKEQVGPRRYVAQLGVIFDRAKAGQFIAASGQVARSAPMLLVPVLDTGGVRQVFEVRGPWQRAWAQFQTAGSTVDYVRPTGGGGDSLILTAGQPTRRSRTWWRHVLNQFSASDVVVPVARLDYQWPGGPVRGTFTARYGPDDTALETFTMTAKSSDALPQMLDEAVVRMDRIYRDALARGLLRPDPTLVAEERAFDAALAKLREELLPREAAVPAGPAQSTGSGTSEGTSQAPQPASSTFTVQFASPDASAVDAALGAVRGASGVQSAATTSLAIGGTSVMRVTTSGTIDSLAAALRAQGWQVSGGGTTLRISR